MRFRLRRAALALTAGACLFTAAAQTSAADPNAAAVPNAAAAPETGALSGTYRDISLGMSLDEVKAALLADGIFGYRGERDVSLLPTMNRTLIETVGYSFIRRSWFQFKDEALYVMTFNLDPDKVDYYSVYKALVEKYGEPGSLDPRKALWTDGKVTLSLERPLTVKYVDAEAFAAALGESGADKAASDLLREDFINGF